MTSIGRQVLNHWVLLAVALAAVLAAVVAMQPVAAQDSTIEYAENGTDPVATFTATDPEGATPIAWDLVPDGADPDGNAGTLTNVDNADSNSFTIDKDGTLKFSSPPDFENAATTNATANTYKVVVVACDVALVSDACPASPDGQAGYHALTVKVTNVDEDGKVTWAVDPDGDGTLTAAAVNGGAPIVQFQVGASLTASVADGDVSGATKTIAPAEARWQWYRSASKTGMGTAIKDATSATYPVTTEDVGMYVRVEAFYNVGDAGREESASLTSDYAVLGSRTNNEEPEFSPTAVTRSVNEGKKGMNVGAPVTATDDISNALNYALTGADAARFEIVQKTGQIKTKVGLDREGDAVATATVLGSCADAQTDDPDTVCTVTVTATDSAGAASNPVATVTINITNVDEEPEFTSGYKMRDVVEGTTQVDNDTDATNAPAGDAIYTATDEDGLQVNLTLMGADAAKFQLKASRSLAFRTAPDYENPTDANKDNVYEVTVRASDGTMHADRMVKVTVTNADEAPKVMGKDSVDYAENGEGPVATFTATDPEGVTPIAWDIVTGGGDPDGDGGSLVAADNVDSDSFTIDEDGRLKFSSSPDHEASTTGGGGGDVNNDNRYHVVVVACDVALVSNACPASPDGQAGYHKVTVKVTDVAETGKVIWTVDPDGDGNPLTAAAVNGGEPIVQFQVGAKLTASVTDGDIPGPAKTVTATDHNLTWRWYRGSTTISNETDDNYTVTTEDARSRIGVEAFYNVGVTGREESPSLTSDYVVLGSRTNNEAPEFSPTAVTRSVNEGKKGMNVGAPVTATDDISNALNYVLSTDSTASPDNAKFEIDQKTGQIKTAVDLNRESEEAADDNDCGTTFKCVVQVIATDSAGVASSPVATVTITLDNVDEKPKFSSGYKMRDVVEGTTQVDNDDDATNAPAGDAIYTATDPDGQSLTYRLVGADAAKFQFKASRSLAFRTAPNYENPTDANKDNVYEVTVRASDGTMHADRMVKVTVTDNHEAPLITVVPATGLTISGPASKSYPENDNAAVATYEVRGKDAAKASWTLEGADAGDFNLSTSSGASTMLMFVTSPNYEDPDDANTDNVYMVTLKATYGNEMDTHEVRVTVTDVDDSPPSGSMLARYDADRNGTIERTEALAAINDYLFGTGADAITRAQALEVINLYLFG